MPEKDDDRASSAADDPTAIWDGASEPSISEQLQKPPATAPHGQQGPSIEVALPVTRTTRPEPSRAGTSGGSLSWAATVGIALVVGALAFVLVRYLRGML